MASIVITIDTDGAALNNEASTKTDELLRILCGVTGRLNASGCGALDGMILHDRYGTRVGKVEIID